MSYSPPVSLLRLAVSSRVYLEAILHLICLTTSAEQAIPLRYSGATSVDKDAPFAWLSFRRKPSKIHCDRLIRVLVGVIPWNFEVRAL